MRTRSEISLKLKKNFIVYSIGENRMDEGGVEGEDVYTGDLVMEVRR